MMSEADRANVDRILATASQGASKPVSKPANDMGFGVAEAVAIAQLLGQLQAIGKNPGKERYKQIDPQTDKLAQIVGTDIVTGATQIGVSPGVVAGHISYYLKGRGVNLTPDQVLALAPQQSSGAIQSVQRYLPYLALGAAAFYVMSRR